MKGPRRAHETVVLAPHPDDAAFSASGVLLRERAANHPTLVLTLFSGGPPGEGRIEEERRAAKLLGCDAFLAGLPDAPFRGASHRSLTGIVLGWDEAADAPALDSATRLLADVLRASRPSRLMAPLGVGRHVDHRIAFLAAVSASRETGTPLAFYEDRPYALVPGAVEHRLAEIGVRGEAPGRDFLDGLLAARYVVRHLSGPAEATELRNGYAALAGARPSGPGLHLTPTIVRVHRDDLPRLAAAVAAHESQLPAFVGTLDEWRSASGAYAASLGFTAGYVERIWRVMRAGRAAEKAAAC